MLVFNDNQIRKFYKTCSYIYFIFKEKTYIIYFISIFNQFESLNMSMVPQIDDLAHKLCDLCEYTVSKSTVLKRFVTIKHSNKCAVF